MLFEEQMVGKENELNNVLASVKQSRVQRRQPFSTFNVVLAVYRYHAVNVLNPLSNYLAHLSYENRLRGK